MFNRSIRPARQCASPKTNHSQKYHTNRLFLLLETFWSKKSTLYSEMTQTAARIHSNCNKFFPRDAGVVRKGIIRRVWNPNSDTSSQRQARAFRNRSRRSLPGRRTTGTDVQKKTESPRRAIRQKKHKPTPSSEREAYTAGGHS